MARAPAIVEKHQQVHDIDHVQRLLSPKHGCLKTARPAGLRGALPPTAAAHWHRDIGQRLPRSFLGDAASSPPLLRLRYVVRRIPLGLGRPALQPHPRVRRGYVQERPADLLSAGHRSVVRDWASRSAPWATPPRRLGLGQVLARTASLPTRPSPRRLHGFVQWARSSRYRSPSSFMP